MACQACQRKELAKKSDVTDLLTPFALPGVRGLSPSTSESKVKLIELLPFVDEETLLDLIGQAKESIRYSFVNGLIPEEFYFQQPE